MTTSTSALKRLVLVIGLAISASAIHAQDVQLEGGKVAPGAEDGRSVLEEDTDARVLTPKAVELPDSISDILDRRWADRLLPAAITFGVMSLAPALLLMTTCFVRMSVVLSLTRQAIGTANLPSTQIITSLALFLSALVMWPVWTTAYQAGVEPYQAGEVSLQEAFDRGSLPIRRWMSHQIEEAGNRDTVALFLRRHPDGINQVDSYDQIPTEVLLPAFLVSELEVAFMIGFRILLPFLVLDCVVATLVVSTGLVMLPPTIVSLPLKLLVFVMADGWSLVVRGLLDGVCLNTS
jgi:flagellar biosynthesis protein FliP